MAETVSIVANDHCTLNIDVAGEYNVQLASVQGNYGVYLLTTDDWISFTYNRVLYVKVPMTRNVNTSISLDSVPTLFTLNVNNPVPQAITLVTHNPNNSLDFDQQVEAIHDCTPNVKYLLGLRTLPIQQNGARITSQVKPCLTGSPFLFIRVKGIKALSRYSFQRSGVTNDVEKQKLAYASRKNIISTSTNMFMLESPFTLTGGEFKCNGNDLSQVEFQIVGLFDEEIKIHNECLWMFQIAPGEPVGQPQLAQEKQAPAKASPSETPPEEPPSDNPFENPRALSIITALMKRIRKLERRLQPDPPPYPPGLQPPGAPGGGGGGGHGGGGPPGAPGGGGGGGHGGGPPGPPSDGHGPAAPGAGHGRLVAALLNSIDPDREITLPVKSLLDVLLDGNKKDATKDIPEDDTEEDDENDPVKIEAHIKEILSTQPETDEEDDEDSKHIYIPQPQPVQYPTSDSQDFDDTTSSFSSSSDQENEILTPVKKVIGPDEVQPSSIPINSSPIRSPTSPNSFTTFSPSKAVLRARNNIRQGVNKTIASAKLTPEEKAQLNQMLDHQSKFDDIHGSSSFLSSSFNSPQKPLSVMTPLQEAALEQNIKDATDGNPSTVPLSPDDLTSRVNQLQLLPDDTVPEPNDDF